RSGTRRYPARGPRQHAGSAAVSAGPPLGKGARITSVPPPCGTGRRQEKVSRPRSAAVTVLLTGWSVALSRGWLSVGNERKNDVVRNEFIHSDAGETQLPARQDQGLWPLHARGPHRASLPGHRHVAGQCRVADQ